MRTKKENDSKKCKVVIKNNKVNSIGRHDRLAFSVGKYYDDIETKPPSTPKPRNNKK